MREGDVEKEEEENLGWERAEYDYERMVRSFVKGEEFEERGGELSGWLDGIFDFGIKTIAEILLWDSDSFDIFVVL